MDSSSEPTTSETAGASDAEGVDEVAGHENDTVIADALVVIDQSLAQMMSRELVSGGEVADLLLDVRTALTAAPQTA